MKLSVKMDCYVKRYGLEQGLERLARLGYEYVDLTLTDRYDAPFTTEWGDEELKKNFAPIGEAIRRFGLRLGRVYQTNEMYNLLIPESFEARKKMLLQSLRAAHWMGATHFCVKPLSLDHAVADAKAFTKEITFEVFTLLKREAEQLGIGLAVVNNTPRGPEEPYGCEAEELLELCEAFGAVAVIDPANAYRSMVRTGTLLSVLKEHIGAVLLTDAKAGIRNPALPLFGSVGYKKLYPALHALGEDVHAVTVADTALRRYTHFSEEEGVYQAVDELLFETASFLAGKKEEGRKEQ